MVRVEGKRSCGLTFPERVQLMVKVYRAETGRDRHRMWQRTESAWRVEPAQLLAAAGRVHRRTNGPAIGKCSSA
jgi:hypothetical protein